MTRFKGATGAQDTKSVGYYAAGNTEQAPMPVELFGPLGTAAEVQGDLPDNTASPTNPVLAGGVAADPASLPAVATATRVVNLLTDLSRRLLTWSWVQGTKADNVASPDNPVITGGVAADPASLPAAATAGRTAKFLTDLSRRLLTWTWLAAGELHVGQVGGEGDLIDVTLVADTSILADGDIISDVVAVSNALRVTDGTGILQSLLVLDEDDQGVGMDLLFFNANVSLGTVNAAPSITDANMRNYLGRVSISASDFTDWGGVRTATKTGIGLFLKSVSGARTVYVAAVSRGGTPTYTASGIRLRLGVLWN